MTKEQEKMSSVETEKSHTALLFGVLLVLMSAFQQSYSSIISGERNLLSTAKVVQVTPNNTVCCNTVDGCEAVTPSPWCVYDDNTSTTWKLSLDQQMVKLTLNLSTPSILDSLEVILDSLSLIPSSITVKAISQTGTDSIEWTTYFNATCQTRDEYLRRQGSEYYGCVNSSGQPWSVSIPKGLFSITNGSDGWLWWRPFHQLQLTIQTDTSEYNASSGSAFVSIADVRLLGWEQPTGGCNCHPVGVNDTNNPCSPKGACVCRPQKNADNDQCVPYALVVPPAYGRLLGGTTVVINGSYMAGIINATIGDYRGRVITNDDSVTLFSTSVSTAVDLDNPLPIGITWNKPNGSTSFILADLSFTYKQNPIVTSIIPGRSIVRGGIVQTVTGEHLDSITTPFITIFINSIPHNFTNSKFNKDGDKFCQTINSSILTCVIPKLEGIFFDRDTVINAGIGIDIFSSVSLCSESNGCKFSLADPEIYAWTEDPMIFAAYKGQKTLTISGQGLNLGSSLTDYTVTVGHIQCEIISLITNTIIFVPPNSSRIDTSKQHAVVAAVGYYSISVGNLRYYNTWIDANKTALIIGLVVGVGGAILIAIIIIIVIQKLRRPRGTLLQSDYRYPRNPGRSLMECLSTKLQADVEKYRIPKDRITFDHVLGKGNFGIVNKGTMTNSDGAKQLVAIKSLHAGEDDINLKLDFLSEALVMADFCHKNVLSLIAIVIDQNDPYVVLPFMEHGDLRGFVSKDNNSFTAGDLVIFSLQVAEGMEYLANRKFVHRDLAARNCMINKDFLVKVADFGLARDIFESDYYRPQDATRPLPIKWMALECLSSSCEFTEKSDIWSYGVLVWELMTRGKKPYSDVDNFDIKRYLKEGRRLEKSPATPDFMYDLMQRCWLEDRNKRPRFRDIVQELKEILSLAENNNSTSESSTDRDQEIIAAARKSYLSLLDVSEEQE